MYGLGGDVPLFRRDPNLCEGSPRSAPLAPPLAPAEQEHHWLRKQRRPARVEHGPGLFLHALSECNVLVPRMVVRIRLLWPNPLDDARSGLDQPPGQQARLPKRIASVALADLGRLAAQVEGVARPA